MVVAPTGSGGIDGVPFGGTGGRLGEDGTAGGGALAAGLATGASRPLGPVLVADGVWLG